MTLFISWIDQDGLAGTLKRIGIESFVKQPSRAVIPQPTGPLVAISTESLKAPTQEAVREVPEFAPPAGPLRERLVSFIDWLSEASSARTAFLVDHDGLPLIDRQADPDLIAIASSIMQLVDTINDRLLFPVGSSVTLEVEEGQLHLMTVKTNIGKYIVGQVVSRPISSDLCEAISDALRTAFTPTRPLSPA